MPVIDLFAPAGKFLITIEIANNLHADVNAVTLRSEFDVFNPVFVTNVKQGEGSYLYAKFAASLKYESLLKLSFFITNNLYSDLKLTLVASLLFESLYHLHPPDSQDYALDFINLFRLD